MYCSDGKLVKRHLLRMAILSIGLDPQDAAGVLQGGVHGSVRSLHNVPHATGDAIHGLHGCDPGAIEGATVEPLGGQPSAEEASLPGTEVMKAIPQTPMDGVQEWMGGMMPLAEWFWEMDVPS
jgi:hypothetical protein